MPTTNGIATEFITFSRASLATVTDADGKIKWAPHNLLSNSESFGESTWVTAEVIVAQNVASAPNGTTTADRLTSNITGICSVRSNAVSTDPATYTIAFYAKAGTQNFLFIQLNLNGASQASFITFDLTNGTVGTKQDLVSSVTMSGSTENAGDGWWRCSVVFTSGTSVEPYFGAANAANSRTSTSGGTILLWGAHLYRSDLGGMQANTSVYPFYNPTTPKNLLGYSEDFSNAAWSKLGITVTANQAVSPNGLTTADLAVVNNGPQSPSQLYQQLPGGQISTTMTLSGYVKKSGASYASIGWLYSAGVYCAASFNLDTQTLTRSAALGGFTIIGTPSITALADGWFRISITATTPSTAAFSIFPGIWPRVVPWTSGNPDAGDTGNGTSGIFVWGAQLSNSASVDPYSSNGFAAPATGAYHGPRRDFDSSGTCRGLLVEIGGTNLVKYSNQFDHAEWANAFPSVPTIVANTTETTAPDGTNTADKIIGTGTFPHLRQSIDGSFSGVYTISIFVKAGTSTQSRLALFDSAFNTLASARINWSGSVLTSLSTVTGTASFQALANGWYRVVIVGVSLASDITIFPSFYPDTISPGTGTVYAYGAQLEAGSLATSYIPTAASAVGRSQDVAFVAASSFPYSTTEGSFVVNCTTLDNGPISVGRRPFSFDQDGTFFFQIGATYVYDDSAFRVDELAVTPGKHGVAVKTNDFAVVANAGAARTGTGAFTGNQYNILRLGRDYSGLNYLNGHVRQITYIPRRLTNAELQTRTT